MKTKKLFVMFVMAVSTAMYAHQDYCIGYKNTFNHENSNTFTEARKCPSCGEGILKQYSKVVNKRDYSRNCLRCNGTGRQGVIKNGKIVYSGPACRYCDGTGHPYKQVVVYYLKCDKCNAEF